jgi:uncharacterized protein YqgC (DUF456 family)
MNPGEALLALIFGVLMVIALFVSLLPFLPGPLLLWGISVIYGLVTNFQHVTILSIVIMTILMIVGSTTEFWTPFLGMKSRGTSCSSVFGMIVGGMIGTLAIPIPIAGTLIGAMIGAIGLELMRLGSVRLALKAGSLAFESFVWGMVTEFGFNLAIVAVFFISLLLAR